MNDGRTVTPCMREGLVEGSDQVAAESAHSIPFRVALSAAVKRGFRTPPAPGIRPPANGFSARKSISSRLSSSSKSRSACRENVGVSATVRTGYIYPMG